MTGWKDNGSMWTQIGFRVEARSENGVVDTYNGDRIDERIHEQAK